MSAVGMSAREIGAAAIAASVVGAEYAEAKDVHGAPDGTRDFDLVFADRHREPLEASTAADEAVLGTSARMSRLDRDSPALTRAWTVGMPSSELGPGGRPRPTGVREFHARVESLLVDLEAAGCYEFGFLSRELPWQADPATASTRSALAALGCEYGVSSELSPGQIGRLYVAIGAGGYADADLVALAVEQVAVAGNVTTNADKLKEPPDATCRHLFVQIHSSNADVFFALDDVAKSRIPELPEPITTAWVYGGGTVVFSVTPPGAWERHEIGAEVLDAPEQWVRT